MRQAPLSDDAFCRDKTFKAAAGISQAARISSIISL
jgi:hypothetical protein